MRDLLKEKKSLKSLANRTITRTLKQRFANKTRLYNANIVTGPELKVTGK